MTDTGCLPPDLAARLALFCSDGKAGRVVLDIKDGRVVSGEFVEKFAVRPARSA